MVHKLRNNYLLYLITLISIILLLIGSLIWTSVSLIWGQRLTLFFIGILLYLLVFLGVDPILKGIIFTLIPIGSGEIFSVLLELIPRDFYQQWLEVDTTRGGSPVSLFALLVLALIIKLSKEKPYIKQLEENKKKQNIWESKDG